MIALVGGKDETKKASPTRPKKACSKTLRCCQIQQGDNVAEAAVPRFARRDAEQDAGADVDSPEEEDGIRAH